MLLDNTVNSLSEAAAIDLACGSGRELVFLAWRGWGRVVGIDYLPIQLERSENLIHHYKVPEGQVELINRDMEKNSLPTSEEFREAFHLVTVARYLHRPHFPEIGSLMKPGGFLVFHTFMKGCEDTAVGRPRRPQFLLKANELAEHFNPTTGFEIIADKVDYIHDGRPCSFFVARKL